MSAKAERTFSALFMHVNRNVGIAFGLALSLGFLLYLFFKAPFSTVAILTLVLFLVIQMGYLLDLEKKMKNVTSRMRDIEVSLSRFTLTPPAPQTGPFSSWGTSDFPQISAVAPNPRRRITRQVVTTQTEG